MPKKPKRVVLPSRSIRFDAKSEREEFKRGAKLDGFDTVSGWNMFHMRRRKAEVLKGHG